MGLRVCAAGDAMLLRPFPNSYTIRELQNIIKSAQVRLVNLESVFSTQNVYASSFCGGQWIHSDFNNFGFLQKYGFNLYACANNHSMDYSFDGLLEMRNFLKEKQAAFAGIGKDLAEAEAPAYLTAEDSEGNVRTIAMISVTTTFLDAARAGYGNQYFPGRPGINALRHKEVYHITKEKMDVLREIAAASTLNGERDNARRIGSLPPEPEKAFNFGGIFFREDEIEPGKKTSCDKRDLARILQSIQTAKCSSDYIFVMAHSHQIKSASYTDPDYFFEEFCRACIDAGASAVFGSGTHQLKPIEIYHGKPIFYSLGNFIFQSHLVDKLPDDFWDKYSYSRDISLQEALAVKSKSGAVGLETDINNYLSIIPLLDFTAGQPVKIMLYPVSLSFRQDEVHKGLPCPASRKETEYIYQHLKKISKPYGTSLFLDGGYIAVQPA